MTWRARGVRPAERGSASGWRSRVNGFSAADLPALARAMQAQAAALAKLAAAVEQLAHEVASNSELVAAQALERMGADEDDPPAAPMSRRR